MGASVGVFVDQMSTELKEAVELSEKQKYTIAEYDSALLDREASKVFKKHGKIIKTLTSRTKAQLKRTLNIKNKTPDDIYKITGGNNNYAIFMKQLHLNKQEIEMENLKNSSKTELYDEEMLVNIIGTSSNKELRLFCEAYEKEKGTPLKDVFFAKTKPESQLQRFVAMCFTFDRDESKNFDNALAYEQAAEIHKAGAARLLGCDEELIFKILVRSSRAQCAAIADSYLSQFHIKFERAINMKFKGNCAKLMLLYALPLPSAIITCIHTYEDRMIIDKVAIISMVSKYDKDILAQVDIAAEKLFEKNLVGIVQRGLSGNLLKAVSGWVENPSPDKGYERVTELFIETQEGMGRSLADLLKKDEFQQRLLFLVKKEQDELDKFMKENRIKFNPEDKLDLRALGFLMTMDSFDAHHVSDGAKKKDTREKEALNKYSVKDPEQLGGKNYEEKYKALQAYFKSYFSSFDTANRGYFPEEEFWDLVKKLPLQTLGLTESEVDNMMTWCEWVADEKIQYHEAIFEFADSILTSIEAKTDGETDVLAIVAELNKDPRLRKATSELKVGRHESVEALNAVPDYFLQYIYDTFFAYDFDNNGYLCIEELEALLPVLNIGLNYTDFIANKVTWLLKLFEHLLFLLCFIGRQDHSQRSGTDNCSQSAAVVPRSRQRQLCMYTRTLTYRNVSLAFVNNVLIIAFIFYPQICLVDKDSGLFFWFNCRDESSQWADTEGEGWAGYGSRRASTMAPASAFSNTLMDAALGDGGSTKSKEPPRSPRAPTRADEKETDAKHASGKESKSAGIAAVLDGEEEEGEGGGESGEGGEATAQSKKVSGDDIAAEKADAASEPGSESKTEPTTPAALLKQASLKDVKEDENEAPSETKSDAKTEANSEGDPAAVAASAIEENAPAEAKEEPAQKPTPELKEEQKDEPKEVPPTDGAKGESKEEPNAVEEPKEEPAAVETPKEGADEGVGTEGPVSAAEPSASAE